MKINFAQMTLNKRGAIKYTGATLIELAAMSFLFVVIALLGVDMGILIFAADSCDKTARDCARAASICRTPGQAIDAMNAALAAHAGTINPLIMSNLQANLLIYEDYSTKTPYTNSGGTNGPTGTTTGSVSGGGVVPSPYTSTTMYLTNTKTVSAGSPGPYCVVQTSLQARVPAPVFFFGAQFNGNSALGPNLMLFTSRYCFPITNLSSSVIMANIPIVPVPPNTTSASISASASATSSQSSSNSSSNSGSSSNSTQSSASTSNNSSNNSNNSASSNTSQSSSASVSSSISQSSSTQNSSTQSSASISSISNSSTNSNTSSDSSGPQSGSNSDSASNSASSNQSVSASTSASTSASSTTSSGSNSTISSNASNSASVSTSNSVSTSASTSNSVNSASSSTGGFGTNNTSTTTGFNTGFGGDITGATG